MSNSGSGGFRTGVPAVNAEEVVLEFDDPMSAGTAINIQDGTYSGGDAVVTGDTSIDLSSTGAEFKDDARTQIFLNGQQLLRGNSSGDEEVNWISTTQVDFFVDILVGDWVKIVQLN